jgi:hypothetical protein
VLEAAKSHTMVCSDTCLGEEALRQAPGAHVIRGPEGGLRLIFAFAIAPPWLGEEQGDIVYLGSVYVEKQ